MPSRRRNTGGTLLFPFFRDEKRYRVVDKREKCAKIAKESEKVPRRNEPCRNAAARGDYGESPPAEDAAATPEPSVTSGTLHPRYRMA